MCLWLLCSHVLRLDTSKLRVCEGYVCQLVANIGKKGSVQTLFSLRSVFAVVFAKMLNRMSYSKSFFCASLVLCLVSVVRIQIVSCVLSYPI